MAARAVGAQAAPGDAHRLDLNGGLAIRARSLNVRVDHEGVGLPNDAVGRIEEPRESGDATSVAWRRGDVLVGDALDERDARAAKPSRLVLTRRATVCYVAFRP